MNETKPALPLVSAAPHIRSPLTTAKIMRTVLIALAPAGLTGIYYFGPRALLVIVLSAASCVFFEAAFQRLTHREITVSDLSAAVTGLLLAYNLPADIPFWIPVVGAFFAIVVVKQLFGGLGQNFMNPALGARAFLMAAYTSQMTTLWTAPVRSPISVDAVSSATVLSILKTPGTPFSPGGKDILNALVGNMPGCIGETCAIALILGGIYLLWKKIITWHVPVCYLLTVFVLSLFLGRNGLFSTVAVYELLTGGLMLGAIFMATDYSSSPMTPLGKILMGVGCGALTAVIRFWGGYPEGVCYAILIMNLFVPLLDRLSPRVFGHSRKRIKAARQ